MFNVALDSGSCSHDETPPREGQACSSEDKRERFLSPEELMRVNEALVAEPEPVASYFPLSF